MDWLSAIIGGTLSQLQQGEQMMFNSMEAQKSRDFAADEANKHRQWSAEQAEIAREWNEEQMWKYNSLSGKVAQAERAGVNPMFAVTGNAVSPASANAAAPSGASASAGSPAQSNVVDLVGDIMGMAKLRSEIDVNESVVRRNNANAEGQEITNEDLKEMNTTEIMKNLSAVSLNDTNVQLIASKILNTDADTQLKNSQISELASRVLNQDADTDLKRQQIAALVSEVSKNDAIIKNLGFQNDKLSQDQSYLVKNAEYLGKLCDKVSKENDFFDKVSAHRVALEKAVGDNATISAKLAALSPILGKLEFPHPYEGPIVSDKNSVYENGFKDYLNTYIDIFLEIAENLQ